MDDADFFAGLDLAALLASFSQSASSAVSDPLAPQPPDAAAAGSPESVTSRASPPVGGEEGALSEIERFLMDEEGPAEEAEGISVEEFFDALFDGGEGEKEEEGEDGGGADEDSAKENEAAPDDAEKVEAEAEEVDDADPISKKKRRQMRNRDSAMKSRERKKMYVKDLETKSKYLEAECRRLSYALQCCAAENMALRQSMLKDRPLGAPTAMQESAVLTETLPLVSLLWLVSIVRLFVMPGLPNQSPVARSSTGRDLVMVPGKTSSDKPETVEFIITHGRRCKGTRARIKPDKLPLSLHAAAAC